MTKCCIEFSYMSDLNVSCFCCKGAEQETLLFDYFWKMSKPASRAFKELEKVLYELGAVSSKVVDDKKAVNAKRSVSGLTEHAF